jgi:hypothetical protein
VDASRFYVISRGGEEWVRLEMGTFAKKISLEQRLEIEMSLAYFCE